MGTLIFDLPNLSYKLIQLLG